MRILFLGTASGAGKTTLAAMYCRHLARTGVDAVPFKASNLSTRSHRTADGGEIGIGQLIQARAAGAEPAADMNPVLLRPRGGGAVETVVRGVPADGPVGREALGDIVAAAYDRLAAAHEAVVCEGSGSPAELNLIDRDLANVGLLRMRPMPAVLVGDIERGGVFAAVYGTWLLMPADVRPLLKGFVINRFRGDPSILGDGIERIEELTGMPCLGVMPFTEVALPEEDSCRDAPDGTATDTAWTEELDRLLDAAAANGFDPGRIDAIARG